MRWWKDHWFRWMNVITFGPKQIFCEKRLVHGMTGTMYFTVSRCNKDRCVWIMISFLFLFTFTQSLSFFFSFIFTETSWFHEILLNRTTRAITLTMVLAICLPTFCYMFFYSRELNPRSHEKEYGTCGYYDIFLLPCGPKVNLFSISLLLFIYYMYALANFYINDKCNKASTIWASL